MPGDSVRGTAIGGEGGDAEGGDGEGAEGDDGSGDDGGGAGETTADAADGGALPIAREEARLTLDAQLATFDDVDAKALSIFRLDVAVAGLLVSALSIGVASGVNAAALLVTPLTGASVALFVLSAAAAGLTYTAAGQTVGVGPRELRAAAGTAEGAYRERLVESYADWIERNERTNGRKALLVTLALLGTVAGVLVLGVGIAGALTGDVLVPAVGTALVLLVLALLVDLRGQIGRLFASPDDRGAVTVESLDGSMAGQRTFKGRDRER